MTKEENEINNDEELYYDLNNLTYTNFDNIEYIDNFGDPTCLHNIKYESLYLKKISYQGAIYYLHNDKQKSVYNRFNDTKFGKLIDNKICFDKIEYEITHRMYIIEDKKEETKISYL